MATIKPLADAGFITKTGLVGNATAEAMTAQQMAAAGLITKTNATTKAQSIIDANTYYTVAVTKDEGVTTVVLCDKDDQPLTGTSFVKGTQIKLSASIAEGKQLKNATVSDGTTTTEYNEIPFTFTVNANLTVTIETEDA